MREHCLVVNHDWFRNHYSHAATRPDLDWTAGPARRPRLPLAPTRRRRRLHLDLKYIFEIAKKLGLFDSKHIIRKAAELRRLCDIQFDSSAIGVGEICKAIICLEIAASGWEELILDRPTVIKLSGMSEKAYNRSLNAMQNGLGVKTKLDIRELGIRFGCVRLIPFVQKGLSLWVIEVNGAPGTLYANESYQLQVDFPEHYPMEAPQVNMVVFRSFLEIRRRRSEDPAVGTSRRSSVVTLQRRNVWLTEVKVKERLNVATFPRFLHQNYKKHWRPNFRGMEGHTDEERNMK